MTGEAYDAGPRSLHRGPAGLTLDGCQANYVDNVTSNLVESGVAPDAQEWAGADTEDGPGAHGMFSEDNPSVAPLCRAELRTPAWTGR